LQQEDDEELFALSLSQVDELDSFLQQDFFLPAHCFSLASEVFLVVSEAVVVDSDVLVFDCSTADLGFAGTVPGVVVAGVWALTAKLKPSPNTKVNNIFFMIVNAYWYYKYN